MRSNLGPQGFLKGFLEGFGVSGCIWGFFKVYGLGSLGSSFFFCQVVRFDLQGVWGALIWLLIRRPLVLRAMPDLSYRVWGLLFRAWSDFGCWALKPKP